MDETDSIIPVEAPAKSKESRSKKVIDYIKRIAMLGAVSGVGIAGVASAHNNGALDSKTSPRAISASAPSTVENPSSHLAKKRIVLRTPAPKSQTPAEPELGANIYPTLGDIMDISTPKNPETEKSIMASTVEIVQRPVAGDGNWAPHCSAIATDAGIITAAHCFIDRTGSYYGRFYVPRTKDGNRKADVDIEAQDFSRFWFTQPREYAIVWPRDDLANRTGQNPNLLAKITSIIISTEGKDVALLKYDATPRDNVPTESLAPESGDTAIPNPDQPRTIDDIPKIPIEKFLGAAPAIGERGITYGVPQATNFEALQGIATYLGRLNLSDLDGPRKSQAPQSYQMLDAFAITPANAQEDSCNYAMSGDVVETDGYASGPLTLRYNFGYERGQELQGPDNVEVNVRYLKPIFEKLLKIKIEPPMTICLYTVLDEQAIKSLEAGTNHIFSPSANILNYYRSADESYIYSQK